ncbi:CST complex subunit ctc1 [Desmophyllum pertusum]|uniref:CST complex subunit CTC1 n=1 Tax=Desmophyllum pertusum TaxID=174260 RepID=A0A9X0D3S3_9CNID|nr:CST complex subunit ctc1 [Desmophyllum pertusum]
MYSKIERNDNEQGESTCKRPRTAKEQDDLNHKTISESLDMTSGKAPDETKNVQPPKPRPPVNMSYTGVITKCIKPEAGVFELDGKKPSANLGRGLRVGAHVTTHNVHLCKKGKKTLGLCCCTQSTVRVIKFSPLASSWKSFSPCESPLALLGQVSWSLTLQNSTGRKPGRDSKKESVLELLLSFIKHNSAAATKAPSRNIYDEFFELPHECHPNTASVLTFPWLPTVKEFLDAVSENSCDKPWLSGLLSNTTTATQEKEEWMYKIVTQECFKHPLILVGCLRSYSKTGQLQLFDQTGEIACMIAPGGQQSTGHDCTTDCCKKESNNGKSSNCPYAQTWHSDAMVQINTFEVVMEKFQSKNLVHEDFAGDTNRIYLQFSFDNAEILIPAKDTCRIEDCERQKNCSGKRKENSESSAKFERLDKDLNASLDKKSNGFMCKIFSWCETARLQHFVK